MKEKEYSRWNNFLNGKCKQQAEHNGILKWEVVVKSILMWKQVS